MDAQKFIERIRAAGFKIKTDGRELVVTPAGKLSPEQAAFIKQHADAIHAALVPMPKPWPEIRAAVQAGWVYHCGAWFAPGTYSAEVGHAA